MPMQDMMGGFFGLELPTYGNFPYVEGSCSLFTNSGRAAFECLLRNMPVPETLWVPFFICDTVLEAPERLGIRVQRYSCTHQLQPELPPVGAHDLVLLVNYFGLTETHLRDAVTKLPGQCIVDSTTALYNPPLPGVPTFYSPRKFCGVADGGVATAPFPLVWKPEQLSCSATESLFLLERIESGSIAALPGSESAEQALHSPPQCMSRLTRKLLSSINFDSAASQRLQNYGTLHRALGSINRLYLPNTPMHAPMCYPLICGIPELRECLIDAGIALPLFWAEVIEHMSPDSAEYQIASRLLPLPLDQRYNQADMEHIIELILS